MTKYFILGAPDPEMQAIEELVLAHGHQVVYATSGGRRCLPLNAYVADNLTGPVGPWDQGVVWVECALQFAVPRIEIIDHHQPGDFGYGMAAQFYWEASSLGQCCAMLGVEKTPKLALIAAADHCLTHAYAGQCSDIDPDELLRFRAKIRATFQKRSQENVLSDITNAIDRLQSSDKRVIAGIEVVDLGTDNLPELGEAAAFAGQPALIQTHAQDGRRKLRLLSAPAAVIKEWMATCGLHGVYGDPERGYAGGYFSPQML